MQSYWHSGRQARERAVGDEQQDGGPGPEPGSGADPAEVLADLARLRRRARTTRHAYWFPLVLSGLLIAAATPFYLRPGALGGAVAPGRAVAGRVMPMLGGFPASLRNGYLPYYWLVALLAGVALTLIWYRRHARQVGLVTSARGYVLTGVILTLLALLIPPLSGAPGLGWLNVLWPGDLVVRGTFPFLIIAAGLGVLAWAERSRALAAIAAVYTATALVVSLYNVENVLFRLGWDPATRRQLSLGGLTGVLLPALVLLVAGGCAYLVQRPRRAAA
jgi:hypothetical protein